MSFLAYSGCRLGDGIEISLPPAAYIMKVKLPWLPKKDGEKNSSGDTSSDSSDSGSSTEATREQPKPEKASKDKAKVKVHQVNAEDMAATSALPEAEASTGSRKPRQSLNIPCNDVFFAGCSGSCAASSPATSTSAGAAGRGRGLSGRG